MKEEKLKKWIRDHSERKRKDTEKRKPI